MAEKIGAIFGKFGRAATTLKMVNGTRVFYSRGAALAIEGLKVVEAPTGAAKTSAAAARNLPRSRARARGCTLPRMYALACPGCQCPLPGESLPGPASPLLPERASLYACTGCLALLSLRDEPADETGAWVTVPQVAIPGSAVALILERVRTAEAEGGLSDAIIGIHSEPEKRIVLRHPAVGAIARRAYADGQARLAVPAIFPVTRNARTEAAKNSVTVEGFWAPLEADMKLEEPWPPLIARFLQRPVNPEDPDIRQWPALLQAWEGSAMLVAGTPVEVLGEEDGLMRIRPTRVLWDKAGAIKLLRAPLDFLTRGG